MTIIAIPHTLINHQNNYLLFLNIYLLRICKESNAHIYKRRVFKWLFNYIHKDILIVAKIKKNLTL